MTGTMAHAKEPIGVLRVVGAAILDPQGRCLAAQRGPAMSSPGRWELPGGKIETRESPRAALCREIGEELGLEVEIGAWIGRGEACTALRTIRLDVYHAEITRGRLVLREHAAIRWLHRDQLSRLDWTDADCSVLAALDAWLASVPSAPATGEAG